MISNFTMQMNDLDIIEAQNEISRSIASLKAIIATIDNAPTIDRIVSGLPIVWKRANEKKIDLLRFPRKTVDK